MPEDVCGSLVKGLSTCKQLTILDLSGSTLGAAGCHLVESITSWGPDAPLQQLRLEDCKMPEDVCGSLVKGLSTCKQLNFLNLSGNTLGAAGCHLVESITSWGPDPPLQKLSLRDCKMPEDVCGSLVKGLSTCKQITNLDLSGNTLGAAGCHLVESITSWGPDAPLQQLRLEDCKMPEDVCGSLVKGLSTCKQLTNLLLSGNTLDAAGCHLVESITSWGPDPPLQQLSLRDCKMPEDVCGSLVKGLSTCKQLTDLVLSGKTLSAAGCHPVESITSWGPDAPLQKLWLRDCKMPEDVCGSLVKGLSTCKQLTDLVLSGNTLGAAGCHLVESITSWGPDAPLQKLWLQDCKMPEDVCGSLVKGLSTCKQLILLDLSGNTLSAAGCHLVESITSWGPDAPLQKLWLRDCKMPEDVCGSLVKGLSTCKQLTNLLLSGNTLGAAGCHLVESITSWGPDAPLQKLWLEDCKMPEDVCGSLVKGLSTCKQLTDLVLSGNTLTGSLPNFTPQRRLGSLTISRVGLNHNDLLHLINLVESERLSGLKALAVVGNNLHEMQDLLQRLVESFCTHHQRELELFLFYNNLSDDFNETLKSRCEGTNIKLII